MKNKRNIILIGILTLALLAGGTWYLTHRQRSAAPAQPNNPTAEQLKEQAAVYAAEKKEAIENPTPTQQANEPVPASNITLSTRKESNGTVTVFTKLTGVSDGTCTLTVTNGGRTNTQTAEVIYQPQYSSCAGFSVPINSVGTGSWAIKLVLTTHGTTTSTSITQEIQ